MLIDTHSHIYEPEFSQDIADVIHRAKQSGVDKVIFPAIDSTTHARMLSLAAQNAGFAHVMMGLHPTSVNDNPNWEKDLELVREYLCSGVGEAGGICGVGEIGLDFYWSEQWKSEQEEAFRRQIEWALEFNLPICVHTRSAWTRMVEIISEYRGRGLRGVFHAFSDSFETYEQLRECGEFYFGIGGVVTFKNAGVSEVAQRIPLQDIVLETDCPYLTPVPHRGKRNESSYITYICAKLAQLKQLPESDVARITTNNAQKLFGI